MRTIEGETTRHAPDIYEKELELHYLAPGAFTVISPDILGLPPPDLPPTVTNYRLSPNKKSRKNAAFTIISEPGNSRPTSRSSSPSGRISPFKGRGFNPTGSRHASPIPSPPPPFDDKHDTDQKLPKKSNISTSQRRGSSAGAIFGEKIYPDSKPLVKFKEPNGLSKSLTNVAVKKPPSGPKRDPQNTYRRSAFTRLSPIAGSSPETVPEFPKQNQKSSSSKIPRSRSTPPTRSTSPSSCKPPTRASSRNTSKNPSTHPSRDSSPSVKKNTNVPIVRNNNYKNVKPKVNSFNSAKPKVPTKPQVPLADKTNLEKKFNYVRNNKVSPVNNKNSTEVGKKVVENSKILTKRNSNKKIDVPSLPTVNSNPLKTVQDSSNDKTLNEETKVISAPKNENIMEINNEKQTTEKNGAEDVEVSKVKAEEKETPKNIPTEPKKPDILANSENKTPPTSAAISSATKTATQPILQKNMLMESSDGENDCYLPDARNLSASSVSNALNRMNNTVLDSRTVMKERNISPAVRAIMKFKKGSQSSQEKPSSGESKSVKSTSSFDENKSEKLVTNVQVNDSKIKDHNHGLLNGNNLNNNNNVLPRVVSINIGDSDDHKKIELLTKEKILQKPNSEITVTDINPIQITVNEKPSSEVESGNLIVPDSTANGVGERASINPSSSRESEETTPQKFYHRWLSFFKNSMTCAFCKKDPKLLKTAKDTLNNMQDDNKPVGCWNCRRKLKIKKKKDKIKEDLKLVGDAAVERKWWKKINFFQRKKGKDKVLPTWNQRRKAWMDLKFGKTKEVQNDAKKSSKLCGGKSCKEILSLMFCLTACNSCCRKKEKTPEVDFRRNASITSKKKSLTPVMPVEEAKPKLDLTLVEHTSIMKGAIPVLPIPLAWFCLILNVFIPGLGTVLSGLFCLCFGIPRFSQNDEIRHRIGALLIDIVIGCGQFFTILFCLVGWGWSIWWGVIMLKLARKYKKIKEAEKLEEDANKTTTSVTNNQNHIDIERGN